MASSDTLIEAGKTKARRMAEKALSEFPVLMSAKQVSDVIDVSSASVYRLADRGDFKKTRVHLTWRAALQPRARLLRRVKRPSSALRMASTSRSKKPGVSLPSTGLLSP